MPRTNRKTSNKKNTGGGAPQTDISASGNLSVITSPTCKVCQSPNRHYIDILLARGFSVRAIETQVKEAGEDISYGSIQRHSQNHLNIDVGHFRRMAEHHAQEIKEEVAKGAFRIVSGKAFLDLFIQKGWDSLLFGQLDIQGRDIMSAIKLRDDLEKSGINALEEEMARQLNAIIVAIQEIVPEDLQPKIAARAKEIANNEVMMDQLEPPVLEGAEMLRDIRDAEDAEWEEGGEEDDNQSIRRRVEESESTHDEYQSEIREGASYWQYSEEYDERSSE